MDKIRGEEKEMAEAYLYYGEKLLESFEASNMDALLKLVLSEKFTVVINNNETINVFAVPVSNEGWKLTNR